MGEKKSKNRNSCVVGITMIVAIVMMIAHAPHPTTAASSTFLNMTTTTANSSPDQQKSHAAGVQADCKPDGFQREIGGTCLQLINAPIDATQFVEFSRVNDKKFTSDTKKGIQSPNSIKYPPFAYLSFDYYHADKVTFQWDANPAQSDLIYLQLWKGDAFYNEWPVKDGLQAEVLQAETDWKVALVVWSEQETEVLPFYWVVDLECLGTHPNGTARIFTGKPPTCGIPKDCTPGLQKEFEGECLDILLSTDVSAALTYTPVSKTKYNSVVAVPGTPTFNTQLALEFLYYHADKITLQWDAEPTQFDAVHFQLWEGDVFVNEWRVKDGLKATSFTKEGKGDWKFVLIVWSTTQAPVAALGWSVDLECVDTNEFTGNPPACPTVQADGCTPGLQKELDKKCIDRDGGIDTTRGYVLYLNVSATKVTADVQSSGGWLSQAYDNTLYQADKATLAIVADATQPAEYFVQLWEDFPTHFHGEWPLKDGLSATPFTKKGTGSWQASMVVWSLSDDTQVSQIVNNTVTVILECLITGHEFVGPAGSLKYCGVPQPPVPQALPTCAYSAIGFNPWERWQFFASEGDSKHKGQAVIEGRVAAHNLEYCCSALLHTVAEPHIRTTPATRGSGTTNAFYSISLSGNYQQQGPFSKLSHGGVELAGDAKIHSGTEVSGDVKSTGGVVEIDAATVVGNLYAPVSLSISSGAVVSGTVQTNGNALVNSESKVTGDVHAGGGFTLSGAAQVAGNVHTGGAALIEFGGGVTGNVQSHTTIEVNNGASITGDAVAEAGITLGNSGDTISGEQQPSGSVAPPPAIAPALSVDLSLAGAYFKAKSLEWSQQPNCVVYVRGPLISDDPEERILEIKLHGKVNYLRSVTKEDIAYATKIVLTGNPDGILIWSMPGTDYTTNLPLRYKQVMYADNDGNESHLLYGRVLFNLYEATTVMLGYIHDCPGNCPEVGTAATILAPLADVDAGEVGGRVVLRGSVISKTFSNGAASSFQLMPFGMRPNIRTANGHVKGACLWHTL